MEDLLACRACLITEGKLFDMVQHKLVESYVMITGTKVTADGLPRHLCDICAALLRKSVSFRKKCDSAQNILKYALKKQKKLTTSIIKSIDRDFHSLRLPLTITTLTDNRNLPNYTVEELESSSKVKEEIDNIDTMLLKYESDDEPLSKTVEKKTKLKNNFLLSDCDDFDNFSNNDDTKNDDDETTDDWQSLNDIELVVLSKQEQINEVMSRKDSMNYLRSHYKCGYCYRGFISEATFNNHMAKHDMKAGTHSCDVCHTRWRTAGALRVHVATCHERKYVCRQCGHVANSSHAAKDHSRWHLGLKYTCKICEATFIKSSSHLTHLRMHHPSEHSCDTCGASFIGKYGLAMHRKKSHREQNIEDSKLNSDLLCVKCGFQFKSVDAYERHTATAENCSSLRPCLTCGESFSTQEQLQEHSKTHKDGGVWCKECNRTFAHQKSYVTHYHRKHLRDKSTRDVTSDRAVCEVCGKKCVSAAALRYHQRAHSGERPYPCSVCPKRFAMPLLLQNHLRTHTGERPYKCSQCPKAFSNRAALVRHNRVHTGVKPYPCPECNKCFTQSNSRKLHINTVHRKEPAPYKKSRKDIKSREEPS